jgi:hypothetical protein
VTYTSLDAITRRYLLEKRLTLHWYVQSASLAASCLRQLHIDTLKIVNTVELTVDGTGGTYTATLPNDFQDYITIGSKTGQFVRNLPQREGISRLQNFDSRSRSNSFWRVLGHRNTIQLFPWRQLAMEYFQSRRIHRGNIWVQQRQHD